MPSRTLLDELELPLAQCIDVEDSQALVRHAVPGLDGDLLQRMGRRAARVAVTGVVTGPESRDGLERLRDKLRGTEPVDFVADIATATRVTRVLVEELDVRELAGRPERFEYAFLLREYNPPPPPQAEDPPDDPPPPIDTETGTLSVEVIMEGEPDFDMSRVAVTAEGPAAGPSTLRTLTTREGNRWTETGLPPGRYVVRGAVAAPPMSAQAEADVRGGQTAQVTLRLVRAQGVARAFVVTFRFDSAFVEPCMRAVLRRAAAYAAAHPSEHLVVLGHTDRAGSPEYNQSLSERRARTVFACLDFGNGADRAVAEWTAIRQTRTGGHPTEKDSWGAREYQQMLQQLGFYPGEIDGEHGPLTNEAIRAFRCRKGLPPGTQMDDAVWAALIRDYLADEAPTVRPAAYLANCAGSRLEWLGAGEQQPLADVETAHRPSRRVELLFVTDARLPCEVPVPDTWALPAPGHTAAEWCLGPGSPAQRACFISREGPAPPKWTVEPAEPAIITARGTIVRETEANGVITTAPAANTRFVLIASDGEFKQSESPRGTPTAAVTQADGTFSFPGKRAGVYVVEIQAPVLARLADDPGAAATGPTVCKALLTDASRMDVVILRDPVLREIRLPVIAHLMTALHPTTRDVRTCPDPGDATVTHRQRTARDEAAVRDLLTAANRVWGQARVRFELRHTVGETFATAGVTQCHVTEDERNGLFADLTSPGFVNLFFFGSVEAAGEAGVYVHGQVLDGPGNVVRNFHSVGMGDRVLLRIIENFPPVPRTPTQPESEVILAHELGHYLSLDHVTSGDTARRLMLPQEVPENRRLVAAEVQQARASDNARDCGNIGMQVTGAVQFGRGGHRFVAIRDDAAPPVVVDAVVPPSMLDAPGSTFTMRGGQQGASPTQRTVLGSLRGRTEVIADWRPAGGGSRRENYVAIHVLDFDLAVDGARALGNGRFLAVTDPNGAVVVRANVSPQLIAVPDDLAAWQGGAATDDPLRRRVPVAEAGETPVSVTIAGVTKSVTIVAARLSLDVQGAEQVAPGEFHAAQEDDGEVTVTATLTPPVPDAQVEWTGGEPGPDPRIRIVSKEAVGLTTVVAQVGAAQQQAAVQITSFTLSVAGATEFGGSGSGRFVVVAAPGQSVTVTADIAPLPNPLPPNFVRWTGGQAVPGQPLQRRVPAASQGPPVIVTARAAGGAPRSVTIHVVTFELRVQNAAQLLPANANRFMCVQDATQTVTVDAVITPAISPAPADLVVWTGDPVTDAGPTRRTFLRDTIRTVQVNATVGGVTRTVVVDVSVFALRADPAVASTASPAGAVFAAVDTAPLTVQALLGPIFGTLPPDFVQWSTGTVDPASPARVTVPRDAPLQFDVRATITSTTRTLTITLVQLEVTEVDTPLAPALTFVRVGLWDDAFDTATGALLNGATDATNFISRDSRKFHFRVRDPVATNEVRIDWRTRFDNGVNDDVPPSQSLSLLEPVAGSHVFASRAVMLVTDTDDRNQGTNSGLPAGHADAGVRARGTSNHRLRVMTVSAARPLTSEVFAEYTPAGASGVVATVRLPVFQRTPDDRRRIRFRFHDVRTTVGVAGGIGAARFAAAADVIRSVYARGGIFAEITTEEIDPPAACTGWPARFPGTLNAIDPSVEGPTQDAAGNMVPGTAMTALTTLIRARPGFDENDIHLVYVAFIYNVPLPAAPLPAGVGLGTRLGGQAFADAFTTAASGGRSFGFVAARSGITRFVEAHEATHMTTNLAAAVAGGHFSLQPGGAPAAGPIDGKNLMINFPLADTASSSDNKRLWDRVFTNTHLSLSIPAQFTEIRRHRFIRPY